MSNQLSAETNEKSFTNSFFGLIMVADDQLINIEALKINFQELGIE